MATLMLGLSPGCSGVSPIVLLDTAVAGTAPSGHGIGRVMVAAFSKEVVGNRNL